MFEQIVFVLFGFAVISLLIRCLLNISRLTAVRSHLKAYNSLMKQAEDDPTSVKPYTDLAERKTEIIKLFQITGISPPSFTRPAMSGTFSDDPLDTIRRPSQPRVQLRSIESFHEAIGYFRARRNETIDPIFWIESLLNWPSNLLGLFGFDSNGPVVKFFQVMVLALEVAGGFILRRKTCHVLHSNI